MKFFKCIAVIKIHKSKMIPTKSSTSNNVNDDIHDGKLKVDFIFRFLFQNYFTKIAFILDFACGWIPHG